MSWAANMNSRMPGNAAQVPAQAIDHLLRSTALPRSAGGFRLMNMAPRLEPPPPAAGAAERGADAGDRRIGHHDVGELLLQPQHRLERNVRRGARRADDEAAVVGRKIALRRLDVEHHRQRDGRKEHQQRQEREAAAPRRSVRS